MASWSEYYNEIWEFRGLPCLHDDLIEFMNPRYLVICVLTDRRVDDWFLMGGFTPTLVLSGLYLLGVKYGMQFMQGVAAQPSLENRQEL